MNQNSQTPPEFQKKKNSINPKYIAGAAAFVVAAGAVVLVEPCSPTI